MGIVIELFIGICGWTVLFMIGVKIRKWLKGGD